MPTDNLTDHQKETIDLYTNSYRLYRQRKEDSLEELGRCSFSEAGKFHPGGEGYAIWTHQSH